MFFQLVVLQFPQLLFLLPALLINHLIYDVLVIKDMSRGLHISTTVLLKTVTPDES